VIIFPHTYTLELILVLHVLRYEAGSLDGLLHFAGVGLLERGTEVGGGGGRGGSSSRTASGTNVSVEARRAEQVVVGASN